MSMTHYQEFETEDRIYIVPEGTAFFEVGKQPKPPLEAVHAVSVGLECPLPEKSLCIGIDENNLSYRCKHMTSYGEKTNSGTSLDCVWCNYDGQSQVRKVGLLKSAHQCAVDELGCIHPVLGDPDNIGRCPSLVAYVPSDLSVPHNYIVCHYLRSVPVE
jgi:hypothetical protein